MDQSTSGATHDPSSLVVPFGSLLVAAVVAIVLGKLNVAEGLVGTISSGVSALIPTLVLRHKAASKGKWEQVDEIVHHSGAMNPLLVWVIAGSLILFVEFLSGVVFGFLVASTLGIAGVQDMVFEDYGLLLSGFLALFLLPFTIVVSKQVSHRVPSHPLGWIAGTIALSRVLSFLMTLIPTTIEMPSIGVQLFQQVVLGSLLMLPGIVGHAWAKRTQALFVLGRLARALEVRDREALIALAREAQARPS